MSASSHEDHPREIAGNLRLERHENAAALSFSRRNPSFGQADLSFGQFLPIHEERGANRRRCLYN